MKKIHLIIEREFMSRVRSKQFILSTLLTPVLLLLLGVLPVWIGSLSNEKKNIWVIDQTGLFNNKFENKNDLTFTYPNKTDAELKSDLVGKQDAGMLIIPKDLDMNKPEGITYLSENALGMVAMEQIERTIRKEIENQKMQKAGISQNKIDSIRTPVSIQVLKLSGQKSSVGANFAFGMGAGFLMYIFMFIYGMMVLRGVVEEKSSRIIEIMASSVRPFELMAGKIVGIGLVGLCQFLLWIVLSFAALNLVLPMLVGSQVPAGALQQPDGSAGILEAIKTLNFMLVLPLFIFYFLGGYFLYASLFAAVGSAVDNESDTQQLIFPITLPIILSIIVAQVVAQNPNSSMAFWFSIFPLTSPIVMMTRLPFEPPMWEIVLSAVLLVLGFLGTTWLAAKIYKTGILMYGKKPSFREIGKWLFYKG